MYDYNGRFMQIECGKIAFERFAPKGFLQSEKDRKTQLNNKIREIEASSGMDCPKGKYSYNADLPPYSYTLFFGAFIYQNDIRSEDLFIQLRQCLEAVRLEDSSKEALEELWQRGINKALREDYQAAINDFQKVYYYANVSGRNEYLDQEVRALNGIALVSFLSGDINKAINYLLTAYARTEDDNAYLPKAQYKICCNLGSLFFAIDRYDEALPRFQEANELAVVMKKADYLANSQYYLSCCQMVLERYEEAGSGFEQLAAWMEQSGQDEHVLPFERLSKVCYKLANQALHIRIDELMSTNERLKKDLEKAKRRSRLVDTVSLLMKAIGNIMCDIYMIDCQSAATAQQIVGSIITHLDSRPQHVLTEGDVNIEKVINTRMSILGLEGGIGDEG